MRPLSFHPLSIGAWVIASGLGLAISGALAGALAPNGGEFGVVAAPSMAAGIRNFGPPVAVAFSMWGAGLGVAQWTIVRGQFPGVSWWPSATIGGWALAGRRSER